MVSHLASRPEVRGFKCQRVYQLRCFIDILWRRPGKFCNNYGTCNWATSAVSYNIIKRCIKYDVWCSVIQISKQWRKSGDPKVSECSLHFNKTIFKVNSSLSWQFTNISPPWLWRHVAWYSPVETSRWRKGGEMKGKLVNGVGSQYPSHYLGTWCIQQNYRWCAHLGC